ncbi:penicillin-binding protein 2 [Methyloversatilis sp.]|uniref:penicillin-binding protein 2 n=1 Tax=Methyloversatilis sp. TaxID=2569862 RepID=UPI0027332F44|nr:penicillin-binding protein 2 [Methyloversatilis sp.]MDP2868221.1 penicillin-binding protein 2 [Methyloversatilis sp.]MDP3456166.1 penicillin-binding protein 2 [Methyloversatilis sp.]MDP3577419.1 penicillin-binding protein 2 [Methyloversatilis sp.]
MNDLHNQEIQLVRFRRRVLFAGALVLVCFSLLLARFVWLQVVMHDYYRTRAEDNRIALLPVTPNRGLIVDRKGEVLARNYSAYTLEIQPSRVDNLDRTIDELATIVNIEARDRKRFRKLMDESRNFDSLPIRTRLSDQEVARFIAQRYRFPGVEVRARLFRQYPNAELASHVLGYMGRINRRDAERIQESDDAANYRGTDHIGKSGLEQHYERELHGLTGVEQVEVTAAGRAVRVLSRTPPQQGNNLRLTLDAGLQRVVETAFGDRRGALVAIEPSTGGVLALVSKPTFDPNLFVDGIDTTSWDALNNSPDYPLLNRAIYSAYPPGSTFKPFMALGALTAGKRTPEYAIADPGHFDFGGHRFRDDKVGGHGSVDMHKSIVVSCNTYYYRLASDWGIDGISNFMGQLGLGSRTGIDIDGESTGVLPSQAWKKKRFKRPDQQKWYAGETISVGIGQGYNAYTMIQLAHATAILAADGVVYRPHVVRQIENSRTGAIQLIEPEPVRRVDLRQADIDVIKRAMEDVNRVGTGSRAFAGAPYVAAGKTGTAQAFSLRGGDLKTSKLAEKLRDHALFIAYAPADNPKIALAVLVENAGFGSQSAAPIARQVFDYYLLGNLPAGPAPEDTDATDSE